MQIDSRKEEVLDLPMAEDINDGYGKGIKELRVGAGDSFWVRNGKVTLGTGSNQVGQEAGVGSWWGAEEFDDAPASISIAGLGYFENIVVKDDSGNTLIDSSAAADIVNVINSKMNTNSQQILADFDFGSTDYAGAVKSGDIAWNPSTGAVTSGSGVVVYRKGIVGANAGVVTFSINATTGAAYFAGELAGASGTFGTITSGNITGVNLTIGTGNTIFKTNTTGSSWWGHADFGSAPAVITNAGDAYFSSITITGGTGVANLSDAGNLAVLDDVGASNCDTTIISGGKVITGLLTADNIQVGTLIGRTIKANNGAGSDIWMQNNGILKWVYNGGEKSFIFCDSSGNVKWDADNSIDIEFNSNGGTGENFTILEDSGLAFYIDGSKDVTIPNGSIWVESDSYFKGDVSAQSFTDRTPFYEGNAIEDLKKIKGKNGQIDHDSLPDFMKKIVKNKKPNIKGKKILSTKVKEEIGRDLGGSISVLIKAVLELSSEIDTLKQLKIK